MGNVGEQRAERDDKPDPMPPRELDDLGREGPPPDARFGPDEHHHVVSRTVEAGRPELVRGPLDHASDTVHELHLRTYGLEVEEFFGIDRRELRRVPHADEVLSGERGRISGVVPPPEGGHQDRASEIDLVLLVDAAHGYRLKPLWL